MKFKKTIIATAIMAFSSGAMAEWISADMPAVVAQISPTQEIFIVKSVAAKTEGAGAAAAAQLMYMLRASQAIATNDAIVFELTNGATFNPAITPILEFSTDGGQTAFEAGFAGVATGDATKIKFVASTAVIAGQGVSADPVGASDAILKLNSDVDMFDLSNVPPGMGVDIKITTYVGADSSPTGTVKNFISGESFAASLVGGAAPNNFLFKGNALLTCAGSTQVTDTADVAEIFKEFVVGTPPTTVIGSPVVLTSTVDAAAPAAIPAETLLYKIVGDFTGITSVSAAAGGLLTGSDETGDVTDGTANLFLINTAKTEAYATNTAATLAAAIVTVAPTFTIDGVTPQAEREFVMTAEVLEDAVPTTAYFAHAVEGCDTATYAIDRNGSSFLMNTLGTAVKLKISDVSGKDLTGSGKVTFTGYEADGTEHASTLTSYTLTKDSTVSIPGADIVASFPTTVKKVVTTVESESIIASSVRTHPTTGNKSTIVYVNQELEKTGGL